MNRGTTLVKILLLFWVVTLLNTSCGEGGCAGLFRSKKGTGVPVMVERVKVKQISPVVTVTGKLMPNDKADISFPNDVRVQEVYANVGSNILAGDPLFRLAEDDLNNEMNVLRARRSELEALIDKNSNLLRSRERMLEEGKVDQDEITRLEKEIASQEAELERIKAESVKLSYNLDHVVVTSPISGLVVKREVNAGSVAAAGEVLFRIVNVNPIIVSFALDAKQAEDVSIGTPLSVRINDLPGKEFTAKVTYINPELHRVGKTFEVWAAIPNDEALLKAGMSASTEFVSDAMRHSYIIPATAVLSQTGRPYVYKVSKGVAHKMPVIIGSISDYQVEVIDGLESGDIVVVKGGEDLYDGADVSIWRR